MPRLRRQTFRNYEEMFGNCFTLLVFCIAVGIVALGICAKVYNTQNYDINNPAQAREQLLKAFDQPGQSAAERKQLAASVLQLTDNGTHIDGVVNSDGTKDKAAISQLTRVAKTGSRLVLDVRTRNWDAFWHIWALWIAFSAIVVLLAGCFIIYAYDTDEDEAYLMDLPWRKPWPYMFILLTALPIGWPFYIVSAFRTHLAKKEAARLLATLHGEQNNRPEALHLDLAQNQGLQTNLQTFTSAPNAARAQYKDLRANAWRQHAKERRRRLESELDQITDSLRRWGQQIQQGQARRGQLTPELRQLEASNLEVSNAVDTEHLDAEFDRLLALPGVTKVRVINEEISLLVEARLEYRHNLYDLGDWEVRFGPTSYGLYTKELRSGVQRDWTGGYPVYRLGHDGFCFGLRDYTIRENIQKGQFLEAVELAVDCIQSVNSEDEYKIPKAFKRAKERRVLA